MSLMPTDFQFIVRGAGKIRADRAVKVIPMLLDAEHFAHLTVRFNSGPLGKTDRQWLEVRATNSIGSYTIFFSVNRGAINQLLAVTTPSGSSFVLSDPVGGNPANFISVAQLQGLNKLLLS